MKLFSLPFASVGMSTAERKLMSALNLALNSFKFPLLFYNISKYMQFENVPRKAAR